MDGVKTTKFMVTQHKCVNTQTGLKDDPTEDTPKTPVQIEPRNTGLLSQIRSTEIHLTILEITYITLTQEEIRDADVEA